MMAARERRTHAAARPPRASAKEWRVLVVEDHPITRRGLPAILESMEDLTVVGEVESGEEAVARCAELGANLVLMDINLTGMDGLEATRRIKARTEGAAVVVLTVREDQEAVTGAFRAGASGFISKSAGLGEFATMLRSIDADGVYLRPFDTGKLLSALDRSAVSLFTLTSREQQVLELLAEGYSARAIGSRLRIGERTVNTYVANMYRKMGVNNRVSAVREGLRLHLIRPPG